MDNIEKYEHLKFLMQRLDGYYDVVNNKCSFYIGLNTFILGGLLALYNEIPCIDWMKIIYGVFIFMSLISSIYTLLSLQPFSKAKIKPTDKNSLLFFNSISEMKYNDFKIGISSQTEESIIKDFTQQIHLLSIGLNSKYSALTLISQIIISQLILFTPVILLFIIYK